MRLVKRLAIYGVIIFAASVWFLPGREIYMTLEKKLSEYGIYLNEKSLQERLGGFESDEVHIYYDGIPVISAQTFSCRSFVVHSSCTFFKIKADASWRRMLPVDIDTVYLAYRITNPKTVKISATGAFGTLEGNLSLATRRMFLRASDVKDERLVRRYLKKDKTGWYYETAF